MLKDAVEDTKCKMPLFSQLLLNRVQVQYDFLSGLPFPLVLTVLRCHSLEFLPVRIH